MHITETISRIHGIQDELIPYTSALAEEYASDGDLVSLFILAAMCLHYVPNEAREIILRLIMILQASMSEIIKSHSPQSEHVFGLISDRFKKFPPEGQEQLTIESKLVINSARLHHYSETNSFNHGSAALLQTQTTPLTLQSALMSAWSVVPK